MVKFAKNTMLLDPERLINVEGTNRPLDPKNLKRVMSSIAKEGQIEAVQINEDGEIIDGQHRVEACKRLGLPVKVYVDDNTTDIIREFNNQQKKWAVKDYLRTGKNVQLFYLMEDHGVPANVMEYILKAKTSKFKTDEIIAEETDEFETLIHFVNTMYKPVKEYMRNVKGPTGKRVRANRFFYKCLARMSELEGINLDRLINKVVENAYNINVKGNEQEMLKAIAYEYNKGLKATPRLRVEEDNTIIYEHDSRGE